MLNMLLHLISVPKCYKLKASEPDYGFHRGPKFLCYPGLQPASYYNRHFLNHFVGFWNHWVGDKASHEDNLDIVITSSTLVVSFMKTSKEIKIGSSFFV